MLDADAWRDGFDAESVDQGIEDAAAEATTAGINSTPSFLVGRPAASLERVEVQSLDAEGLRPAIEQALAG